MFTKKFFKIFILFLLLTASGTYIYIYNLYKNKTSETGLNELVARINNSEKLPDKFIEYYLKVENYDINKSTNTYLFTHFFDRILSLNLKKCPCFETNYGYGVWDTFDRISLGIQLDERVEKRKCIEYYLQNKLIFPSHLIGVNDASLKYFNKEIKDLNSEQMLRLAVMSSNPYHNRKHHLQVKFMYWKNKINK